MNKDTNTQPLTSEFWGEVIKSIQHLEGYSDDRVNEFIEGLSPYYFSYIILDFKLEGVSIHQLIQEVIHIERQIVLLSKQYNLEITIDYDVHDDVDPLRIQISIRNYSEIDETFFDTGEL